MKIFITILVTLTVAVPLTWWATRNQSGPHAAHASGEGRKLLYYQSAMHPWIKSDAPGRCTICGMELTPVYEGDAGFQGGDLVQLTQGMIEVTGVQTVGVKTQALEKTLLVAGTIEENATRHRVLSTYVAGRIEKLHVNFIGADVKEGQPLAEFYSPALLQAEREYRNLSGELRAATRMRLQQMGLTAGQIDDLARKPADQLTSQIVAPIGGTVVAQRVFEGQYVQEGETLFEIADFSIMWFQFRAYEDDLPWIKLGLRVDITTPSHPGRVFTGNIRFIDPTLDEATRSTKVRVELENPLVEGRRLLLQMLYADGRVHLDAPTALTVPRTAIIQTGPEAVAYVEQEPGIYTRRVVKIGQRGDTQVEVLAGLAAGEKVVVSGNLLIDGQAEMNRGFAPRAAHSTSGVSTNTVPLTQAQQQAVATFVAAVDEMSAALAADDLTRFNTASGAAASSTQSLAQTLESRADLIDILKHLSDARQMSGATDLAGARKSFHPFSNAAARLLEMMALEPGVPAFALFECPMVDRAIPGVPKKGRWVQAAGRPLANPYFGAAMLTCGNQVKL